MAPNVAQIMLFFYVMIGLLLVAIAVQQWQLQKLRRRVHRIEQAFEDALDDDDPEWSDLIARADLRTPGSTARLAELGRSIAPAPRRMAMIAISVVLIGVMDGRAEPATPQQVLQERSTAAVAQEIGQLVIERAQLRASVEVLREALAKSEARVRELETKLKAAD